MFFRHLLKILLGIVIIFSFFSCTKKGNFINEDTMGKGVHYYPIIVYNYFVDTITSKFLNQTDTTFYPDQKIIFEMDYFSRENVKQLELWAGKSQKKLTKALEIPYNSSLYSQTKYIDTVLFQYTIPDKPGSSTWYLQARVVTEDGLSSSMNATINLGQ